VTADPENPLLDPDAPPRFDLITPEHVVPAMRSLLADLGAQLDRLEASAAPAWDAVVEPITRMTDRLALAWGTVGHLMGVRNSDALRKAHETVQPEVVAFSIRLGQSKPVHRALKDLETGSAWASLDETQRRIVASLVRDAELSGVALEGAAQERFTAIQTELAEVSTRFSNNVLDATKAWALELRSPEEIDGLPRSLLELAAQAARQAGDERATADVGPWRITLDAPSYVPFMQHGRRRDLRERLHRAFVTRSSSGEHDNTPLLDRILRLRREQASASRVTPR
jgi:oligopeptidase A